MRQCDIAPLRPFALFLAGMKKHDPVLKIQAIKDPLLAPRACFYFP